MAASGIRYPSLDTLDTQEGHAVIVRGLVLIGVLVGAAACWWGWSYARCERACDAADAEATALFERGALVAALERIDAVDARCDCGRFVDGDAPPQYSLAVACLQQLRRDGRGAEADGILAAARGPILMSMRRRGP
jgi:hypothetical protein